LNRGVRIALSENVGKILSAGVTDDDYFSDAWDFANRRGRDEIPRYGPKSIVLCGERILNSIIFVPVEIHVSLWVDIEDNKVRSCINDDRVSRVSNFGST
jgi:hypothetical protein